MDGTAQYCRDSHLIDSLAGLVPRQPLHTRFFQLGTMVVKYAGDAKRSSCASRACRAVRKRPLQESKRAVEASSTLHPTHRDKEEPTLLLYCVHRIKGLFKQVSPCVSVYCKQGFARSLTSRESFQA